MTMIKLLFINLPRKSMPLTALALFIDGAAIEMQTLQDSHRCGHVAVREDRKERNDVRTFVLVRALANFSASFGSLSNSAAPTVRSNFAW